MVRFLNVRICTGFFQSCRRFASTAAVPSVAVVGSGPGGFYSAQHILKRLGSGVCVDIFEKEPIPFGLVRYGVAPDHPEVKNVINTFTQIAENPQCNFFGNIVVGKDVLIRDLQKCYSAVVLAYGCTLDKKLNIPGEDLKNVLPASSVINWYNGYPGYENLDVNLGGRTCVILGQGNVAVDVARIFLSPLDLLEKTDITEHALKKLSESRLERVFMVGRRGPVQAAFTTAEFRETIKLPGCRPVLQRQDFIDIRTDEVPRPKKRLVELQRKTAMDEPLEEVRDMWLRANKELHYVYKRSPLQLLESRTKPGEVGAVEFGVNKMEDCYALDGKAVSTGEIEILEADLVIQSIGYSGIKIEKDMPFDEKFKITPNKSGRVHNSPGLYCTGWIKTGPVGVIVSTMNSAYETGKCVVDDIQAGIVKGDPEASKLREVLLEKLSSKYVTFSDWKKLDEIEIARGKALGKSRLKVLDKKEMLALMKGSC